MLVIKAESSDKQVLTEEQAAAIQSALEAAGVEFTNGGQPGVRLKRTGLEDERTRVSDLTSDR